MLVIFNNCAVRGPWTWSALCTCVTRSLGQHGNTPVTISAPMQLSSVLFRPSAFHLVNFYSVWNEMTPLCQQSSLAASLENNETGFRYRQLLHVWNAIFLKCCVTWAREERYRIVLRHTACVTPTTCSFGHLASLRLLMRGIERQSFSVLPAVHFP